MTRYARWLRAGLLVGCFFVVDQAVAAPADDILKLSSQVQSLLTVKCLGIKPDCQIEVVDKGRCGTDTEKVVTDFNEAVQRENAGDGFCGPLLNGANKGVYRQVRVENSKEDTWWDGFLPDPRKDLPARVLSRQSARLYSQPDANSTVIKDSLQWFEAFSVLDSQEVGGETWYRVTETNVPPKKGDNYQDPTDIKWMRGSQAIPWRQALVMSRTNQVNRPISLFFKDRDTLRHLTEMSVTARADEMARLRGQAEKGQGTGEVLGVEPKINTEEQEQSVFYPITDFYPPPDSPNYGKFDIDGQSASLLEVAARVGGGGNQDISHLKIDIMFVMDTTESMQPFVDTVRDAMKNFTDSLTGLDIHYGFIGYRDTAKYFDYTVKPYTDSTVPSDQFVDIVKRVTVQKECVPSKEEDCKDDFPEAVFQGVNAALESKQWRPDAAKLIFLVGDAPGRPDDNLTASLLHDKAWPNWPNDTEKFSIYAFLLKNTKLIKDNRKIALHSKEAEKQYTQLTSFGEKPAFMIIDGDSETALHEGFSVALDKIEKELADLKSGDPNAEAARGSLKELIFRQAEIRLASPDLPPGDIQAWVSDKAPENSGMIAWQPSVLLTRQELGELRDRVGDLIKAGGLALRGEGESAPDFFELVRLNTMWTLKNPQGTDFNERFRMPSGLDRLPYYKSYVMRLTNEDFRDRDTLRRLIDMMNAKQRIYNDRLNRRDVWKKLGASSIEKDEVVILPLNALP